MTEFVPQRLEPVPDNYRVDDLSNAYADAYEQGLWVKEFGQGPSGNFLVAIGSYYELQQLEHENPGLVLDPEEFAFDMGTLSLSLPGVGATRHEAIYDGIQKFLAEDSQSLEHQQRHAQVMNQ